MFTGIVTDVGRVAAVERDATRARLRIASAYDDLTVGESVSVSGACLTVVAAEGDTFSVDVVITTRGRTRLAELNEGDAVNLERALEIGDRLGGHFVQGHVDGLAAVTAVRDADDAVLLDLRVPEEVWSVTVPHGSIAVDGVSLTVNAVTSPDVVQVALIPHTKDHTTLGSLAVGAHVHVEGDYLGKLVRRHLMARES